MAQLAKCGKHVKNTDDMDKTWTVLEKSTGGEELSLVDPTGVICSAWTRNGDIRSTVLLLDTFNNYTY